MQSLRQTALMILPLLGVEGVRLLRLWLHRAPGSRWNRGTSLRVALYSGANLAGQIFIKILAPNCVTMYGELTFNELSQIPDCIETCFRALRSITGLKYLDSDTPLVGIAAVILVLMTVAALCHCLLQRENRNGSDLLLILFGCSILSVLSVSIVINIYTRSIYIFPWYPLAALAAVVLADRWKPPARAIGAALLLATLMGNLFLSYGSTTESACSDEPLPQQQVAQYLMDKGYTRVYGPWMQVSGIAVWTDGQVAAGSWYSSVCQVIPYITPTDIFSDEDNENACYLAVGTAGEQELLDYAASQNATMTLLERFEGTGYALFASSRQLMYFGTD